VRTTFLKDISSFTSEFRASQNLSAGLPLCSEGRVLGGFQTRIWNFSAECQPLIKNGIWLTREQFGQKGYLFMESDFRATAIAADYQSNPIDCRAKSAKCKQSSPGPDLSTDS
jgi:hypothetical protein